MERSEMMINYFSYENENIEMYACYPWYKMNGISSTKGISSSKGNGKMKRKRALSNSNKNFLGICFITDIEGYFKYIHSNFLNLFEGVENQFFETSVLDKNTSLGSPSILKYLVAMVQQSTPDSFLKNRFSKFTDKFHKMEWNIVSNSGLLYFSLAEKPITSMKEHSALNQELSPEQILSQEIKKLFWKIEHAKMFNSYQISSKKQVEIQLEKKGFEETLEKDFL